MVFYATSKTLSEGVGSGELLFHGGFQRVELRFDPACFSAVDDLCGHIEPGCLLIGQLSQYRA